MELMKGEDSSETAGVDFLAAVGAITFPVGEETA